MGWKRWKYEAISGEMLREKRTDAGLTQRALADLAGVHVDAVRYWERRKAVAGWAPDRLQAAIDLAPAIVVQPVEIAGPQSCGAKTRRGTPCKMKAVAGKARCKLHGGMSTGPKTEEGRKRIAIAQRRRWLLHRTRVILNEVQQFRA